MLKKGKSTFSHFFKEDAKIIQDILQGEQNNRELNIVGSAKKELFPKINSSKAVSEDDFKAHWRSLRLFFRNSNNTKGLSSDLSPVIMAPMYTNTMVGTDFPIWVADENFDGVGECCLSLKEILSQCIIQITEEEDDAHILRDNIERIIHIANEHLKNKKPQLFRPAIEQVLDKLVNRLEVSGDEVKPFNIHLKNFKKALPENGVLLPYTNNTSLQILEAAMLATQYQVRKKFKHDIKQLKCRLKDLLRVEREKGPERKNPDKLQDSLAFVDSMMNFNKLSSILPGAGSESMGEERINRITSVVSDLEEAEPILDQQNFLFIDDLLHDSKIIQWENLFENSVIEVYQKGNGCDTIRSAFDQHIASWTKLIVAKKIGELEFENDYQADVHDEFFRHLNWQSFSAEELNNCPHFILIAEGERLFDTEFSKLSALISSNIPVKIVAVKRDDYVNYNQNGSDKKEKDLHTHAELGGLMLSHRNIYVAQSTSITPNYLFNGFKEGLSAFAPAFFYVLNVDENIHENAYLWTSATIESRDFPGFTFKGLLGTAWGSRFGVDNNPQPDRQWPIYNLTIIDEEGNKKEMEFPFTFADQAVLNPNYHHYYLEIDSSFWSEDLIPLTDYMGRSLEENIGKIPFIWMMNATNELRKVAVSWAIVLATQERIDFWRFLQENSGINNYHVTQAIEQARVEMLEEQKKVIEQLNRDNQIEIQKIREEEAGKVMENLTSVLLNLDTTNVLTSNLPDSKRLTSTDLEIESDKATTEEPPKEVEEDESVLTNDPYIDTVLCTSCNECTEFNGAMFKYNADKMAYIADPKAGTFSDLVEAAEMCPVRIIHPGSPLDPNEPDLESLIERAKKFN